MKNILLIAAVCLSVLLLSGQTDRRFKSVDVKEFEQVVRDSSFIVLDVRTPAEHAEGFIPGTDFNIDVLEDDFEDKVLKNLPAGSKVALYCRSGNRSKTAARKLAAKGYQVVELATGFRGWLAAGKLAN